MLINFKLVGFEVEDNFLLEKRRRRSYSSFCQIATSFWEKEEAEKC